MSDVVQKLVVKVCQSGHDGISHVGAANYQSRESEAKRSLQDVTDSALEKAIKLDYQLLVQSEALKQIEQFSDSGNPETAIVGMKAIASEALKKGGNKC